MNREFVFERDTGIMFQRAKMPEQPFKLKNNQFTKIPRLESVSAEEYNRQFEEMIRSMPKNLAYSDKFGTEDIIPPGLSQRKSRTAEKHRSAEKLQPAEKAPLVREVPKPVENQPEPVKEIQKKETPKKEVLPNPEQKPKKPVQEDEQIVFYTGYDSQTNPFTDDSPKDKEFVIGESAKKAKPSNFTERFKQTFHKLFSTPAEDEFPDDSFE